MNKNYHSTKKHKKRIVISNIFVSLNRQNNYQLDLYSLFHQIITKNCAHEKDYDFGNRLIFVPFHKK